MTKWIDIKKELPPMNKEILVCYTVEYDQEKEKYIDFAKAIQYGCRKKDHIEEENAARKIVWNGLGAIEFSSKVKLCTSCPGEIHYENLDGQTIDTITHWMPIPKLP